MDYALRGDTREIETAGYAQKTLPNNCFHRLSLMLRSVLATCTATFNAWLSAGEFRMIAEAVFIDCGIQVSL